MDANKDPNRNPRAYPEEYRRRAELAFAACRAIDNAVADAARHNGEYNLFQIMAARRLSIMARSKFAPKWTIKPEDQEKFDSTEVDA